MSTEPTKRTVAQGQEREPLLELAISRRRYGPSLSLIRRLAKQGPLRGLDIGCGYRAQLVRMANAIPNVSFVGCDVAVDPADTGFFTCDIESTPATPRTFDLVTMHAVFEHLGNPSAAMANLAAFVKPGGFAVISAPTPLGKLVLEFLCHVLHVISRREVEEHKRYWWRSDFELFFGGNPWGLELVTHRYYQAFLNNWLILRRA